MGLESEEKKSALDPNSKQARLDRIWEQQEGLEPGSANQSKQERLERILEQQEQLESDRAVSQNESAQEKENNKKQSEEPAKMGWGIFIFAMFFSVIADAIEIFTFGTIGWITGLVIDFILFIALGFSKAARKQWQKLIGALFVESFPILNFLPLRSVMITWSFIASRPKLMGKIQKGLKIAAMIPSPVSAELKVASKAFNVAANVEHAQQSGNTSLAQKALMAKSAIKMVK